MGIRALDEPSLEPITLDDARDHLRVLDNRQDGYIDALITACRELAETHLGARCLITRRWEWTAFDFPPYFGWMENRSDWNYEIELPRPPLQTVQSVKYIDTAGVLQTVPTSVYDVITNEPHGKIVLKYDQVWPVTRCERNAVRIEFTAGYGDNPENVPAVIRHAIKLLVGHYFEIREPVLTGTISTEIPMTVKTLLASKGLVQLR